MKRFKLYYQVQRGLTFSTLKMEQNIDAVDINDAFDKLTQLVLDETDTLSGKEVYIIEAYEQVYCNKPEVLLPEHI